jgi:hypothetical protein
LDANIILYIYWPDNFRDDAELRKILIQKLMLIQYGIYI